MAAAFTGGPHVENLASRGSCARICRARQRQRNDVLRQFRDGDGAVGVEGADPSRNDQKLAATKELAMARDAMKSNNLDDCSMHLANAMNAIMKN